MKKIVLFIFAALLLSGVGYAQNTLMQESKIKSSEILLNRPANQMSQEYLEKQFKANNATETKANKSDVKSVEKEIKKPETAIQNFKKSQNIVPISTAPVNFATSITPAATGMVNVTLTGGDLWDDGSGYVMLFDETATWNGAFTTAQLNTCNMNWSAFSHRLPANATPNCQMTNFVLNNSITIQIPAGTYDLWCLNVDAGSNRFWSAVGLWSNPVNLATDAGNNFVFQLGKKYHFTIARLGDGDNLTWIIEDDADPAAPAAPANLTITPDAGGALTAELNWTNPSLTFGGATLTDLTAIKIYQDDVLIHTIPNPIIGEAANYTVTVTAAGSYTYKVVGENTVDTGLAAIISAWIGSDVPAAPTNVQLTNDDMTANVSWTAPTTGLNGGVFSATGLVYDVHRMPANLLVSENQTETTFSEVIGQPGQYSYRIVAKNATGTGGNATSNAVAICVAITTYPVIQNFGDGSIVCWTMISNNAVNGPGGTGNQPTMGVNTVGGDPVFVFSSFSSASGGTNPYYQYLITPELPANNGLTITFDYARSSSSGAELFSVGYSSTTNDVNAFTWGTQVSVTNTSPAFNEYSLIVPEETKYIAINYRSSFQYRLFIKNLQITELIGTDAAITAIVAPVSGTDMTDSETVTATIKNNGATAITTADLILTVNEEAPITETFTGNIAPGMTANYTFTATADLSAAGSHTITVRIEVEDDTNPNNDELTVTITNTICIGGITSFPWTEGFEGTAFPPACWKSYNVDGGGSQWARNTTNVHSGSASAGHTFSSAGMQEGWLITPQIAIPNDGNYILEFWSYNTWANDNYYNGIWISNTNNELASFTEIRQLSGSEISGSWKKIAIQLSNNYAGESVYIGFKYMGNNADGWFIDDVSVLDFSGYVDAEVASIVTPVSGINLSATEQVKVVVKNNGSDPLTGFDLKLELNGATVATETYTATIASLSQAEYTFNATLNLSAAGSHTITVTAIAEDDQVPANDSKTVTVTNTVCAPITSFPWSEGFDDGVPACWMNIDADGDGEYWESATWGDYGGVAASFSYLIIWPGLIEFPLNPDNWLITPQLVLRDGYGYELSFKVGAADTDYYAEKYSVLVSTTGTALSNFTEIHAERLTYGGSMKTVRLDLSQYAGQSIYVAFRHWDSTDEYVLVIDDVEVTERLSITENNNNNIRIYPNPSSGQVTIETSENSIVRILDITGRITDTFNINEKATLNLAKPAGIYFVQVESNGKVSTHKLVITK